MVEQASKPAAVDLRTAHKELTAEIGAHGNEGAEPTENKGAT
jgi:hypothetical protein